MFQRTARSPPSFTVSMAERGDPLIRFLSKAVEYLGLEWSATEEPAHGLLDKWFLSGCRQQSSHQRPTPFLPAVHEELTKTWCAPYSACVTFSTSPLSPPLMAPKTEVSKLPPLCPPSALGLKTYAAHPLKPCRTTSSLANRAYAAAGQAGSALHMMVVLQMFQAKLLCSMDESGQDSNTFKEQQLTGSASNESNGAGNRQSHGQSGGAGVPPLALPY